MLSRFKPLSVCMRSPKPGDLPSSVVLTGANCEVGKYYLFCFNNGAKVWGKLECKTGVGLRQYLHGPWIALHSGTSFYRSTSSDACITSGGIPITSIQEITKEQFDCVRSLARFEY